MSSSDHVTGKATRLPRQIPAGADARLARVRLLAWWLDRAFGVGAKGRFGLDPLLGLIPGVGDWLTGGISLYIVYEALRLGVAWPVIGRMVFNVLLEGIVGVVPLLGDAFDFVWQANQRNLRLVEQHYHPRLRPRSFRAIGIVFALLLAAVVALALLSLWAAVELLQRLFAG